MSSTNRGSKRSPVDFYSTPGWCVRRLVEVVNLPGGAWLEPAAGNGAIIRAIGRQDVRWTAWELRRKERASLRTLVPKRRVFTGDLIAAHRRGALQGKKFAVAISNPPYRLAMPVIEACLEHADVVVMLLRLNFLASAERFEFMRANPPSVYVLPNRPSFTKGKTDSVEYAWFVWRSGRQRLGRIGVLGLTPKMERRRPAPA